MSENSKNNIGLINAEMQLIVLQSISTKELNWIKN